MRRLTRSNVLAAMRSEERGEATAQRLALRMQQDISAVRRMIAGLCATKDVEVVRAFNGVPVYKLRKAQEWERHCGRTGEGDLTGYTTALMAKWHLSDAFHGRPHHESGLRNGLGVAKCAGEGGPRGEEEE